MSAKQCNRSLVGGCCIRSGRCILKQLYTKPTPAGERGSQKFAMQNKLKIDETKHKLLHPLIKKIELFDKA